MKTILLYRVDFDLSYCNTKRTLIETFHKDENLTAFAKVSDYFLKLKPVQLYLGLDTDIYPQYQLEAEEDETL